MTDLENMLIYAARYAHSRKTGAANQVVTCIVKNWDDLSDNTKIQLVKEAENEATCNQDDWSRITSLLGERKRIKAVNPTKD
jgi:hypothetical protein